MIRSVMLPPAVLAGLLIVLGPLLAHAEVVNAPLPSGNVASANYEPGNKAQPAVLVLHGFLQTRSFPTVASVVDAAATAGYPTLAPTLTLGISRRNKSLPCEAIHTHSLDQDAAEVDFWVRWLVKKGHRRIVLVGHSYGNLQLLAYMQRKPAAAVKQLLLISLTDVEMRHSAAQRTVLAQELRARLAKSRTELVEAEIGHCKKYVSPPAELLSYLTVTRESILNDLARTPVPAEVIVGSKDERMGSDWVQKLVARGFTVRIVPGASHFFDNQYEFDLQEAVLSALHAGASARP